MNFRLEFGTPAHLLHCVWSHLVNLVHYGWNKKGKIFYPDEAKRAACNSRHHTLTKEEFFNFFFINWSSFFTFFFFFFIYNNSKIFIFLLVFSKFLNCLPFFLSFIYVLLKSFIFICYFIHSCPCFKGLPEMTRLEMRHHHWKVPQMNKKTQTLNSVSGVRNIPTSAPF